MTNNPVAVFDSGIGSLSIIRELRREVPAEDLLYFADRAHFPYGGKSHGELREIIVNTINYLARYKPKLVVVASNTPTVQVLDEVRRQVELPVIGVRPPLKEAARLTCLVSRTFHVLLASFARADSPKIAFDSARSKTNSATT